MKLLRNPLALSGILLTVVLLTAGVWGGLAGLRSAGNDLPGERPADSAESSTAQAVVELSSQKIETGKIQSSLIERRSLREWRTIPGRLQYNQTRHIELRAPTEGTLRQVKVKPGDVIEAGGLVAVFQSPAIGKARADVLQLEAKRDLASRRWEWEESVLANTEELIETLSTQPELAEVEAAFKSRTLGQARETLMTAYARYQLAGQLLAGSQSLRTSGAMSMKTLQERTAGQRTAEAAFRAAREQVLFDTRQRAAMAKTAYESAQRALEIGRQKLHTLLGYADKASATNTDQPLSLVELRSPMTGTVEQILAAPNERVSESDPLLVIADTSTLWVAAEIRDSDWSVLQIDVADWINVQAPALPGQTLKAQVVYIGRKVSEAAHALPVMAEIPNANGLLRPGLFVRVKIPVGKTHDVPAVPPGALMRHEGKTFVFVDEGDGRFSRVDVITGQETPDWIEIRKGPAEGVRVVDRGAFVLKSELLLEGEDE